MIKLSILVPSTHTRYNTFLPKIQEQLYTQYDQLSYAEKEQVEILVLVDNKKTMLGSKRNSLVDMAQGVYVVFVDDDDIISDYYIKSLLYATENNTDVISFTAMVSLNGEEAKPCYYSKDNKKDYNTNDAYYRIPNHITCVKKEVSLKSSFPSLAYAEDSAYAKLLLPHLKTEYKIDEVLYHYNFSSETTETQQHLNPSIRRRNQKPIVDVVILSNAKDMRLHRLTQNAIDSCIAGSNSLPVNVIVVEQNSKVKYKNADIYYEPGKFNYNRFANIGISKGSAEWAMLCNNDVVFHSGWLHALLIADHPVMSPKCPNDYRQKDISENEIGDQCGRNISGWAIFAKRDVINKIGGYDEDFDFYCADNSFIEQIKVINILPMIVPAALVTHLGSFTLRTINNKQVYNELTFGCVYRFNQKYGKNLFEDNPNYNRWKSTIK